MTTTKSVKKNMGVKDRNETIAKFLGWFKEDGQPETWFKIDDSAKYVVYSEYKDPFKELPFHKDYNYLMEALEKIRTTIKGSGDNETKDAKINEYFIDELELKRRSLYIRLIQWTKKGWRMFDHRNRDLSILYTIGYNCKTYKEGIFFAVSDIAKVLTK